MSWFEGLKSKSLEQRTPEWYEYRKKHINASDVGSILGLSPFKSKYQLWHQYVYDQHETKSNWAMQRGTQAEPRIKALYEEKTGIQIEPQVFECKGHPLFSASLDGWSEVQNLAVEFKYPSAKTHALAISGVVPPHYLAQIQAQLLCSGADRCDYVSYDGRDIVIIRVERDSEFIKKIVSEGYAFWDAVQKKTPPVSADELIENSEFLEYVAAYDAIRAQISELEVKKKDLMAKVQVALGDRTELMLFDYRISTVERRGDLDYVRIIDDYEIETEKYRKPATKYLSIKRNEMKND